MQSHPISNASMESLPSSLEEGEMPNDPVVATTTTEQDPLSSFYYNERYKSGRPSPGRSSRSSSPSRSRSPRSQHYASRSPRVEESYRRRSSGYDKYYKRHDDERDYKSHDRYEGEGRRMYRQDERRPIYPDRYEQDYSRSSDRYYSREYERDSYHREDRYRPHERWSDKPSSESRYDHERRTSREEGYSSHAYDDRRSRDPYDGRSREDLRYRQDHHYQRSDSYRQDYYSRSASRSELESRRPSSSYQSSAYRDRRESYGDTVAPSSLHTPTVDPPHSHETHSKYTPSGSNSAFQAEPSSDKLKAPERPIPTTTPPPPPPPEQETPATFIRFTMAEKEEKELEKVQKELKKLQQEEDKLYLDWVKSRMECSLLNIDIRKWSMQADMILDLLIENEDELHQLAQVDGDTGFYKNMFAERERYYDPSKDAADLELLSIDAL